MWFTEACNNLGDQIEISWLSMSDVFEKENGKRKLEKLFDKMRDGSKIYYRIKSVSN